MIMSINRRRFMGVMASGAALLAAPAIGRAQSTQVLRLAHPHPDTDSWQDAGLWMNEALRERTDGALGVQVFANGILGNDSTMINAVRGGTIDIMVTGNPFFTGLAPKLNVLDLPFLFKDRNHVAAVLDGEIGDELRAELEPSGIVALATWETGWRNVTNSRRPVQGVEDLKGLKIRTTPNPAHIRAFELLGAVPTPMAFTELFTALEMRSIDGQENPTTLILNSKFNEVQRYLSLTQHAFTTSPLVTNKTKLDAMDPALREALVAVAREAAVKQRQMNAEREISSLETLKSEGMEVVETPDREALRAVVADNVREAFAAQFGAELPDRIAALG